MKKAQYFFIIVMLLTSTLTLKSQDIDLTRFMHIPNAAESITLSIHGSDTFYTQKQKLYVINDYYKTKRDSAVASIDSLFDALPALWRNLYELKLVLLWMGATDTTKPFTQSSMAGKAGPYGRNTRSTISEPLMKTALDTYNKLGYPLRSEIRLTGSNEKLRYKPKILTDKKALAEWKNHMDLFETSILNLW